MIEGILITDLGLIEIGFVDDKSFLLKAKSDSLLRDNSSIEYGFVLKDNKIYSCKYSHSKFNYQRKIAGTGILLTEVFSMTF